MRPLNFLIMFMAAIYVIIPHHSANSQSAQEPAAQQTIQQPPPEAAIKSTQSAAESLLPFDERNYVEPSYYNLAHLYWGLGILDINRDSLIDSFLAITECKLYKTYYNNDLEWGEIRESTKEFLRNNYKIFPTSFKIMIPLYLGRYDYEEEYFEVLEKESAINSVRYIETLYNSKSTSCMYGKEIEGYPRNLTLYLNRPFSMPRLPVEKELARLFLDEANTKNLKKERDINRGRKVNIDKRYAYLELMFRVHSYKETIKTFAGGSLSAVVYAQIDYVRVYADYDKEKLLYDKDMYEGDKRRRKKRVDDTAPDPVKLPDGPLFQENPVKK